MPFSVYRTQGNKIVVKIDPEKCITCGRCVTACKHGARYDVIFMDHMMPTMDGIETTTILRSMGYDRPIVALTANAVVGQTDIFLKNGFDDYISKPIDTHQLDIVLKRLIRDKHPTEVVAEARKEAGFRHEFDSGLLRPTLNPKVSEIFVRDVQKALAVLEPLIEKQGTYSDEEIRTYVIHIHGMKGALANIGKRELATDAFRLESAGRAKNTNVMVSDTPAFLKALRNLVYELRVNEDADGCEPAKENVSLLREKLLAVKLACEEYDEQTADEIVAELREQTWSVSTKKLLRTLAEHLLHSDFEESVKAVNAFLEKNSADPA